MGCGPYERAILVRTDTVNSPPFIPINQRCQWQSELMKVNRWKSESIVKVPLDRSVEILDRRPSLRFVEQVSHRDLGVCGVAGVQALFLAASWAYRALKIGGAAYLVYSGGRMILRSRRRSNFIGNPSEGTRQISRRRALCDRHCNRSRKSAIRTIGCEHLPRRSAGKTYAQHRRRGRRHYGRCLTWLVFSRHLQVHNRIDGARLRQISHWIDRLAGGMLIVLGLKLARESK